MVLRVLRVFLCTVYLWQWWKLLFWKLHKISVWWVKKNIEFIVAIFFAAFLITSHILIKPKQYSVFEISVVLWIRSDGLWKKNNWKKCEIFHIESFWYFSKFFEMCSGFHLERSSWILLNQLNLISSWFQGSIFCVSYFSAIFISQQNCRIFSEIM